MKQIKPEVLGYAILSKDGLACPVLYHREQLAKSSINIASNKSSGLIQLNGKPKYRPVYKKAP